MALAAPRSYVPTPMGIPSRYVTSHPANSASYPQLDGKRVPAKSSNALRLARRGRMAHSIRG